MADVVLCKTACAYDGRYIAVSTDEETIRLGRRDIVISWRGTVRHTEWVANVKENLAPAAVAPGAKDMAENLKNIRVETGFLSMYTSKNEESKYNKTSAHSQVLHFVQTPSTWFEYIIYTVAFSEEICNSCLRLLVLCREET